MWVRTVVCDSTSRQSSSVTEETLKSNLKLQQTFVFLFCPSSPAFHCWSGFAGWNWLNTQRLCVSANSVKVDFPLSPYFSGLRSMCMCKTGHCCNCAIANLHLSYCCYTCQFFPNSSAQTMTMTEADFSTEFEVAGALKCVSNRPGFHAWLRWKKLVCW